MNKQAAKELIVKSWHNLSTAILLYDAHHYSDVIAVELHYSCEKLLKAFLAFENKKIPKTHDIYDLYTMVNDKINLLEYELLLEQITKYHIEESYPAFDRTLPPRKEIKEVLDFTQYLFDKVCDILEIDKSELI